MTREEAIHELQEDKRLYETEVCHAGDGSPDGRLLEALNMAIEALSKQDTEEIFCKNCQFSVSSTVYYCNFHHEYVGAMWSCEKKERKDE